MLQVIFTLDYEVHGNGEGCPYELMVEPTERLLNLFAQYGAKLTIMADTAEILKFREFASTSKNDKYFFHAIVSQLQNALRQGHDVQLHIHGSWLNARHNGRQWAQDWSEYNLAALSRERLQQAVSSGKEFLETNLRAASPEYRCAAFRAGNWAVSPSRNIAETLIANGFKIDTSVFKYGSRRGLVNFDYRDAQSELIPWRADPEALWKENSTSRLWEVPIYSEARWIGAFFSLNRIYRTALARFHRFPIAVTTNGSAERSPACPNGLRALFRKHAWKADFNQCTGRQLIGALRRAGKRFGSNSRNLPFVLIGHSKLFTGSNARSLRQFLAFIRDHPAEYQFGNFQSLGLPILAENAPFTPMVQVASALVQCTA